MYTLSKKPLMSNVIHEMSPDTWGQRGRWFFFVQESAVFPSNNSAPSVWDLMDWMGVEPYQCMWITPIQLHSDSLVCLPQLPKGSNQQVFYCTQKMQVLEDSKHLQTSQIATKLLQQARMLRPDIMSGYVLESNVTMVQWLRDQGIPFRPREHLRDAVARDSVKMVKLIMVDLLAMVDREELAEWVYTFRADKTKRMLIEDHGMDLRKPAL